LVQSSAPTNIFGNFGDFSGGELDEPNFGDISGGGLVEDWAYGDFSSGPLWARPDLFRIHLIYSCFD
jgi:hypothetical protein